LSGGSISQSDLVQASNPIPDSSSIVGTDLNYRNSWFANSFNGLGNKAVVHSIDSIAVDPFSGSVYTNTSWEEGGMQISQYQNGDKIKNMKDTFGWGKSGGQAVAVNSKYVYGAVTYSGSDACAIAPGNLNSNGLLDNRLCGTTWTGMARYKNTLTQGGESSSEFATFTTGYASGAYMLLNPNDTTSQRCAISGALASETELYLSDYCNDKIQVFDAESMGFLREFNVTKPGKLTMDKQGNLWVLSLKDDPNNYSVGDFKFTYTDTIKVLHYTSTGTKLPQELQSPQITNARGLAVNSRDDLLVAIGGEYDRTNAKQQIYFYNNIQANPTFYKAFGEENGYYGGAVKGQVKDGKFDWITGLAVDNNDNIYISMQKTGVVSYKEEGIKNWQVSGLLFLDSTAPDPRNPNIYYSKWDKFEVDPNRPDGSNWKHLARTYDFTKYPEDQRNWFGGGYFDALPQKVCYLQDKKFLVMNISSAVVGYRFDKIIDGEIAIPAFEIHPGDNWQTQNYIWVDTNGDGVKQESEKQSDSSTEYASSYTDDDCGVWFSQGGKRPIIGSAGQVYNKGDSMNYYKPNNLNQAGFAPDYKVSTKINFDTPPEVSCQPYYAANATEPCLGAICPSGYVPNGAVPCDGEGSGVSGLIYDQSFDTMYIYGFTPNTLSTDARQLGNKLRKYTNWLQPNRALVWTIDLSFDLSQNPALRIGSLSMSGDYIIVVGERFPNSQYLIRKDTGEIKVMPTYPQGDYGLGWIDINRGGILLNKRPDGTYLSTSEDDHFTKSFTNYIKPNSYNSIVTGQLYLDGNGNNSLDSNETGENLPTGTKIKLTDSMNSNSVFYPIINTYGDFAQSLPAGSYIVDYILPLGYTVSGTPPTAITATSGQINNTDSAPVGISVVNTGEFTTLLSTDIPNINFNCNTANHNSSTSCSFVLPVNTILPNDFKITIGGNTSFGSQICSQSGNQVSCSNIPSPNSVGNLPIYASIGGIKTDTGEKVNIIGFSLGSVTWAFTPEQGATSPFFKSSEEVNLKLTNFKSVFDPNPSSDSYVCTLEYRNLTEQDSTTTPWNQVTSVPVNYDPANGCSFDIVKNQRGNTLNQSLRLKVTKINGEVLSINPEDINVFYSQYFYRFQGAGTASGG